jgi:hypothetical protein
VTFFKFTRRPRFSCLTLIIVKTWLEEIVAGMKLVLTMCTTICRMRGYVGLGVTLVLILLFQTLIQGPPGVRRKNLGSTIHVHDIIRGRAVQMRVANLSQSVVYLGVGEIIQRTSMSTQTIFGRIKKGQKGVLDEMSSGKALLDSPPVSVRSVAGASLNVLRAPVFSCMSVLARSFVSGVSRHICRPLSGAGVLASKPCNVFNHLRTTAKLSSCLNVWKREMEGDVDEKFILNGIEHGFDIIDSSVLHPPCLETIIVQLMVKIS